MLGIVVGVLYTAHEAGTALGAPEGDCPTLAAIPSPHPGGGRPWEVEIPVSTYSTWHSRHGNLLTVIPIIGWSGRGPDMAMALYHNAANVNSSLDLTAGMGFDLGPGWTVSYSSQLILDDPVNPTTAIVIADDGTQDVYTWDGTKWVAAPGGHDELTAEPNQRTGPTWTLTHKNQSYHQFETDPGDGKTRLAKIVDATGNELQVQRDASNRLDRIIDAAGRELEFRYDATTGLFQGIRDPRAELEGEGKQEPAGHTLPDYRNWDFLFDENGVFDRVWGRSPLGYTVDIGYDAQGRITSISDKKALVETGDVYTYAYHSWGTLAQVTDPNKSDDSQGLTQSFRITESCGVITGIYTDRRLNEWQYTYSGGPDGSVVLRDGNLTSSCTPISGECTTYEYDTDRNLTAVVDALNNRREFTYDTRGNMLTMTADPGGLNLVQTWTYDANNNVTSYTDGASNTVNFLYGNPDYPTLLTSIIEPPDGQGNPTATTTLAYYLDATQDRCAADEASAACGQLKDVFDPNNVWTGFKYDQWGQQAKYDEGQNPTGGATGVYHCDFTSDSAGRVIWTECSPPGAATYDANNRPTGSSCPPAQAQGQAASNPPAGFPPIPELPHLPEHRADWSVPPGGYSPKGELLESTVIGALVNSSNELIESYARTHSAEYDELGRLITSSITSDEWDGAVRAFSYTYDAQAGESRRTGPDGVETFVALDEINRVQFVRRGDPLDPLMTAQYTYYANGLLESVTYGNFTWTWYTYDAANRLTSIEHKDAIGNTILKLDYQYLDNDLVSVITESDITGPVATVTFSYDNRGRLISEVRTGQSSYDLAYEYDQGGNRTKKIDTQSSSYRVEVVYHYDIDNPPLYGSDNNRLMKYETSEITFGATQSSTSSVTTTSVSGDTTTSASSGTMNAGFPGGGETTTLLSTTYYYYNDDGNVTRVVTEKDMPFGEPQYEATRLAYARNGRAVTYGLGETWNYDGTSIIDHTITYTREFRYDGARQRYLNRRLGALSDTWSDYDGDQVYGDFTVTTGPPGSPPTVTEVRSYQPGIARVDPWASSGSADTKYYHADMIGTTRHMTDSNGNEVEPAAYTAFGEQVGGNARRYGYAGAWGYQAPASDDPTDAYLQFPFLHVGHRYYNPATGRFLQRDPIGIQGGLNVYAYARNNPVVFLDPSGLEGMWEKIKELFQNRL